jgi:hypothetical protein
MREQTEKIKWVSFLFPPVKKETKRSFYLTDNFIRTSFLKSRVEKNNDHSPVSVTKWSIFTTKKDIKNVFRRMKKAHTIKKIIEQKPTLLR